MSERKLHPAAFAVTVYENLAGLLFPVVIAVLVTGADVGSGLVYGMVGLLLSAGYGWARWSSTSYRIEDGALVYRSGVLSVDESTVPAARITALDEVQGPVQRLCGVVALHVQTAGGGERGEIVLAAVTREAVDELRGQLGHEDAAPAIADATWRMGRADLVLAALTGPQFGFVGPALVGLYAILDMGDTDIVLENLPHTVQGWLLLVTALVAIALGLSLLGAVVAFAGFTVRRDERRLVIRRGLLARRSASLSVTRVHGLRIVEGALPRRLGLCTVRLDVAGYRSEASSAQMLLPICRRRELEAVLAMLLPELPVPSGAPGRPPRRALASYMLRPVLTLASAAAAGTVIGHELGAPSTLWLAPTAAVLAGAALGLARFSSAGWWLTGEVVAARAFRFVGRTTTVARASRLQQIGLTQTALQRRARLAGAWFAVSSGHRGKVLHLDEPAARALAGGAAARTLSP